MTKSSYKSDLERFLSNKIFIWSLVIIAVVCFGYSAVNTTISIDDVQGDYYFGSGNIMLSSGRFGMTFWSRLIGFGDAMPPYTFAIEALAVAFFIWACINFCILFEKVTANKVSQASLNIFSLLLVSYPLMNEIWEYSGANLIVCIGYLCVSFVMLQLQKMIDDRKTNVFSVIMVVILMVLVSAGYESLVTVYIFAVTAVLFLSVAYEAKTTWKSLFAKIGIYIGVLAAGIIGRVIGDKLILMIFQLEETINGATGILWGTAPFLDILRQLIYDIAYTYFLRALLYFPLMELLIAIAFMIAAMICIAIKQKSIKILLPGIGAIFSLFALSFLQGEAAPYRTCQVFGIFVAFCGLLLVEAVKGNKYLKGICICVFAVLILQQAMYLSYFLNLNHLRSEEEMQVLEEIGDELATHTFNNDKPVIFLGNYTLSNYITEASCIEKESEVWYWYCKIYSYALDISFETAYENGNRKIVSTNVKSVINWAAEPTAGQGILKRIFWYLGYNYKTIDDPAAFLMSYYAACEQVQNYWDKVGELDWRDSYAILETDNYIIVHFR